MSYKLLQIVTFLCSIVVLRLAIESNLKLYIHPRYILFTIILSGIAFVLLALSVGSSKAKISLKTSITYVPLFCIVIVGLIFTPRSLSAFSVSQRSINNSLTSASNTTDTVSLYGGSSKNLTVVDWSRLLERNKNPDYYANKEVNVIGFVYDDGSDEQFQLARFVVTCCTVDAQPTGIPVAQEKWHDRYKENQWLEISGKIRTERVDGTDTLLLVPEKVKKIEEPDDPYVN